MFDEFAFGFGEEGAVFCPAPSADSQDRLARLRLIRSRRVGPVTYRRLLNEHGSAKAALAALPDVAEAAGVRSYLPCPESVALAEMKAAKRLGAAMLCLGDAAYPDLLAQIDDAPPVLWALGNLGFLQRPMVAVVGTRNASSLGSRMARKLAAELGEAGFVVVSGLARGVDALAHQASLETGTVGVQAGGLDVLYPAENAELATQMGKRGLRLSEQPPGLQPQARHFPRRNRIVSGLSKAVVVVEAAARSGSIITARAALDQGREVLAVPGHPMDARASGCNMLLRDGAGLVRGADDVIEALGHQPDLPLFDRPPRPERPQIPRAPERPWRERAALNQQILAQLGPTPVSEDQVLRDLGLSSGEGAPTLARMELEGSLTRQPGGLISAGTQHISGVKKAP